jgi:hypothetical protein
VRMRRSPFGRPGGVARMSWYLRSLADADTHRRDYSIVTRSVDTGATGRVIGVNFQASDVPTER